MIALTIEPVVRTRNSDFSRFWIGQSTYLFSSQVILLALLIAYLVILRSSSADGHNWQFGGS